MIFTLTRSRGGEIYTVNYFDGKSELNYAPRETAKQGELNLFSDYNYFVFKKPEYAYEKEIRAILFNMAGEYQTIKIDDLSKFIDKIIVSPFAEDWFAEIMRKIADTYELNNVDVIKSSVQL